MMPQRCFGAQQAPAHFVHGAIATHGRHHGKALSSRGASQLHGMPGVFGGPDFVVGLPRAEVARNQRRQVVALAGAGFRI